MNKAMEIQRPDPTAIRRICDRASCHPIIATLLVNRGITSPEAIAAFLNPSLSQIQSFESLIDMDKAVDRIVHAILNREKILVFGDYDVDGITSTTILYEFLTATGADVMSYIPHRMDEGYGLNRLQIENTAIPGGFQLIITIDCGSASHDAIALAAQSGIDVIVTDHHTIYDSPPKAFAIINPQRTDCPSGSGYLAGVGVAFCLLISLRKHLRGIHFWENGSEPNLKNYCDLVALGTIADIVPLIHENRILTKAGLEVINSTPRPGLAALIDICGINKPVIDAEDVAFRIAPRLNATGRMNHAHLAVKLLCTPDADEAFTIAKSMHAMNAERQEVEQKIFQFINQYFTHEPENLNKSAIVLGKQGWHQGVLGIVASRLVEAFYRPVILMSFDGDIGKGSGRSIPGINLYDALCRCSEYLDGFGGHPMAAGIKIHKKNLTAFQQKFEKTIEEMGSAKELTPKLSIDCLLDFDMITDRLIDEIASLQPFGQSNPEPVFAADQVDVVFSKMIGTHHRRLSIKQRHSRTSNTLNAIWFNVAGEDQHQKYYDRLAFKLRWNYWNGKKEIQALIESK
ncbi:MAG: single-stranded-DNA-specific exonuclease RecJ [Desulfobacteraceae bacterium]|nr:MAG: single-stranded-DNA-specific exonuclease RecJ [Desulfobacteraceae bacterium]